MLVILLRSEQETTGRRTKLSKSVDVVIEYEEGFHPEKQSDYHEEGVDVPLNRINPKTLWNLITEFVTREWEELGDSHDTLDDKVRQVYKQLQDKKAKVVFDLKSNTCNIIPVERCESAWNFDPGSASKFDPSHEK